MDIKKKYGYLTFIKYLGRTPAKQHLVLLKCVCGKEVERTLQTLRREKVNPHSCGCKVVRRAVIDKDKGSFDNEMANLFITGRL